MAAVPLTSAPLSHPFILRALALWPGLDRRALSRTHGDAARIARLVTRRSALPETSIVAMLEAAR